MNLQIGNKNQQSSITALRNTQASRPTGILKIMILLLVINQWAFFPSRNFAHDCKLIQPIREWCFTMIDQLLSLNALKINIGCSLIYYLQIDILVFYAVLPSDRTELLSHFPFTSKVSLAFFLKADFTNNDQCWTRCCL